ncbi:TonB-dependent receptor [Sphingobium estronivorans]|uniref:TonB-dependent receptor n=1 Tax=Sphingobium estronivorans TaxID=1577690 RepID=UPI001239493E|nr:TonB-dependent receptor [Sphingobium estronivorans]
MMIRNFCVTLLASSFFVSPAFAQAQPTQDDASAPASAQGLADIIVTAQKRAESLQKTPISIAAFDSEALAAKRIASIVDLTTQVPNFTTTPSPNSALSQSIFIRGVGLYGNTQTRDSAVAVYVDGVYVARAQGISNELADIERIEVLRGPQGTLYGRNATGGAVSFITKSPELGAWHGEQSFTFGNRNEFMTRTRLNVPLGDTVAAEFTFLHTTKDGFVKNLGAGRDYGERNRNGVRGALLWQPSSAFSARYTYDSSWIRDTGPYLGVVPAYPAKISTPRTGSTGNVPLRPGDSRVSGHNLTLSYDVADNLTIKSITGYRRLKDDTNQVYNPGIVAPGLPFNNRNITHQHQFSEEVQLIGDLFDKRLKYVGGAFYFTESGDALDLNNTAAGLTARASDWRNKAYAVYGQATWTPDIIGDRLHLTVGARYSHDDRRASVAANRRPPVGPVVPLTTGSGQRSFHDFSPMGTVQFDVTDNANVYATVSRGYRTGGFNPTASSSANFAAGFAPETLINYEAGFKSEFFDRRIRVNADIFEEKYKDIQTNVFSPFNPIIIDVVNAAKASIKGVEAEVTVLVAKGLTVNGSYGYIKPKYDFVKSLTGTDVTSLYRFPNAPKQSYAVSASYKSEPTVVGTFQADVNYSWRARYFGLASNPNVIGQSYGLLGGRIGLRDVGGLTGLSAMVWGRNLTNKAYEPNIFAIGNVQLASFGEPRSYGVDLSYRF